MTIRRVATTELLALHGSWFASAGIDEPEKGHYQRCLQGLKEAGAVSARTKRHRFWRGVGQP